jgi:hypothetical protein
MSLERMGVRILNFLQAVAKVAESADHLVVSAIDKPYILPAAR